MKNHLAYALLAALTAACATNDDGDAGSEMLYADCSEDADCKGSGLLCDERRGCVECISDDDCPSTDVCRVGVCESEGSSSGSGASDDSSDSDAGSSGEGSSSNGGGGGGTSSSDGTSTNDGSDDTDGSDDATSNDSATDAGGSDDDSTSASDDSGGNDAATSGADDTAAADDTATDDSATDDTATDDTATDDTGDEPRCGDGILHAADEACDDGNTNDGDGCSATCKVEDGASCVNQATDCETIAGQCVIRVPATFRDFPASHPDFDTDYTSCATADPPPEDTGIVESQLSVDGKPVYGMPPVSACITSAASFAEWYTDGSHAETVQGEIVLFEDAGTFSNRFGSKGERWVLSDGDVESGGGGASLESCNANCDPRVRMGLQCENVCRPEADTIELIQLELDEAQDAGESAATLAELEQAIVDAQAAFDACSSDCDAEFTRQVDECAASCVPCSYDPGSWCYGQLVEYDGTPLFFPVDSVEGPTADLGEAKLPEQYGATGWPWESDYIAGAVEHNFSFTTEAHLPFVYQDSMDARVEIVGDDDIFLFVNGTLAIDLGGLHVPLAGSATISAATAALYGLQDGEAYDLAIFHAERQPEGSSFRLSLSGFNVDTAAQISVCSGD